MINMQIGNLRNQKYPFFTIFYDFSWCFNFWKWKTFYFSYLSQIYPLKWKLRIVLQRFEMKLEVFPFNNNKRKSRKKYYLEFSIQNFFNFLENFQEKSILLSIYNFAICLVINFILKQNNRQNRQFLCFISRLQRQWNFVLLSKTKMAIACIPFVLWFNSQAIS